MADDPRELRTFRAEGEGTSSETASDRKKPKHEFPKTQVGKLWDAFGNPEQPVNILPGAKIEATGRQIKEDLSLKEAVSGLSTKHLSTFYKTQCARDSLLLGIGAGFGIGGIRGVVGGMRSIWSACNWAVGIFAVTATAAHVFCLQRRRQELDGMKQAVELMKELKMKKQREKEQRQAEREAAARLAEEEKRRKSWTNLSNYKFW